MAKIFDKMKDLMFGEYEDDDEYEDDESIEEDVPVVTDPRWDGLKALLENDNN